MGSQPFSIPFASCQADKQLPSEFVLELPLDRLHVVDAVNPSPLALLRGDINQVGQERNQERQECTGVIAALGWTLGTTRAFAGMP